jgi:hypothetical protein
MFPKPGPLKSSRLIGSPNGSSLWSLVATQIFTEPMPPPATRRGRLPPRRASGRHGGPARTASGVVRARPRARDGEGRTSAKASSPGRRFSAVRQPRAEQDRLRTARAGQESISIGSWRRRSGATSPARRRLSQALRQFDVHQVRRMELVLASKKTGLDSGAKRCLQEK